ncbi:endonuclease MutS2 [Murimonas intestini]|uniref:endonuclease MutS2 n=1 Tax=Murimonas intestini TaxID=1337051 RepID=UPI0011DDD5CA|nr:DNA mismatch repair protein MutS [Murimonas intestini]
MEQTFQTLEFDKIKDILEEYAYTKAAREKIRELVPYLEESKLRHSLKETTQAREILDKFGMPPFTSMEGMEDILITACQGGCLQPEQLEEVEISLTGVSRMKDFLNRCKVLEQGLPYYEENMQSMDDLREEIAMKIRGGRVDDFASPLLKSLRQEIERMETKVREKAEGILRNNKGNCSDQFVTMRNGHLCLPVKKECRSRIQGSLVDKSSTGQTLFIEPQAVAQLTAELMSMRLEEENEERRILYELTDMVAEQDEVFRQNIRVLEKMDFIFAKGRLSFDMDAVEPEINTDQRIRIMNGRHPFIEKDKCVPLNFRIGDEVRGVIITGPNTGGKTVAIKTVGLLGLMAQCGLHVPCEEGDFTMNSQVLCDIGDGQNITANLSTFSAHITNVLEILKKAGKESLVIMDELGSGTDPAEGMGIAVAILEELRHSGCLFLVTTHYPEVKTYGEKADNVMNARMAFDKESLCPLYRLEIGESGESCAFYIARHLGMPERMLEIARIAAYGRAEQTDMAADAARIGEITSVRENIVKKQTGPKIQKHKPASMKGALLTQEYQIGDCVMVYPDKKLGIVCSKVNDKGALQIQLQKKKIWISHKRVKMHVKAEELYPEDYDFSIIFDTVANRKARHKMEKSYRPDLETNYAAGEAQDYH